MRFITYEQFGAAGDGIADDLPAALDVSNVRTASGREVGLCQNAVTEVSDFLFRFIVSIFLIPANSRKIEEG